MGTINNLSWTASVVDNKDWIHLNPSSGSGDKTIEVTVDNYYGYTEDVRGKVIVTCTGCKTETEPIEIDVCRCGCNCDSIDLTQKVFNVPEQGINEETILAEYSIFSKCDYSHITAKLVNTDTGTEKDLTVNSNNITIDSIPYNQKESQIVYNVIVSFYGHECKTLNITQDALECNCSSVVVPNFNWSESFADGVEIPQTGLTAGTEVFTYTHKQYCPEDSSRLYGKVKYGSYTADLTIENGVGKLSRNIGENTGANVRTINIYIYYVSIDGVESTCEYKSLNQKCTECSCQTIIISKVY